MLIVTTTNYNTMTLDPRQDLTAYKVYALIPYGNSYHKRKSQVYKEDEIWSDYDTPTYRADIAEWFHSLKCDWVWTIVTLSNMREVIKSIAGDPTHLVCSLSLEFN